MISAARLVTAPRKLFVYGLIDLNLTGNPYVVCLLKSTQPPQVLPLVDLESAVVSDQITSADSELQF
jgi:hypothetical protein